MTLPIHDRLMMVAETLDHCAEAIQHDGGDVMIAIQIQEEARVLREAPEELGIPQHVSYARRFQEPGYTQITYTYKVSDG